MVPSDGRCRGSYKCHPLRIRFPQICSTTLRGRYPAAVRTAPRTLVRANSIISYPNRCRLLQLYELCPARYQPPEWMQADHSQYLVEAGMSDLHHPSMSTCRSVCDTIECRLGVR